MDLQLAPHPGTQNAAVQAWSLSTKEAEREDPWVLASLVQEASPRFTERFYFKNRSGKFGEMAQWFGELANLEEYLSLVHSTNIAAHNYLPVQFQSL